MHYKVLGGRLWKRGTCEACGNRVQLAEELIKVTVSLFPIPDMEFALWYGDTCNSGKPTLNYCFCRNATEEGLGGFTMPSYGVWRNSMGPTQRAAYHACLLERYPPHNRLPLAVWRGCSTNPEPVTEENYMRAPRLVLHTLGRTHRDLLDAKLTATTPRLTPGVRELFKDTGNFIPVEDFNRYCVLLHLDGNGWSGRLGQYFIHFPTPILRIASNISAFFEHYLAPGVHLDLFAPDLSDLLTKVRRLVQECRTLGRPESRLWRQVQRRQLLARALMDHVGVAEAMAHALHAYRSRTGFPFSASLEGFVELDMSCCTYTNVPPAFARAMRERWEALRAADGDAGRR